MGFCVDLSREVYTIRITITATATAIITAATIILIIFLCGQSPTAAKMPWGYLFSKNDTIQYKRFMYTVYTTEHITF